MGNAKVFQLGRKFAGKESDQSASSAGKAPVLAEYRFEDIWPSTVSNIDLSYDSSDTIEEFTVDFQVQYWYPVKSTETSDRYQR